jgi:hypothetical protein
VYRKARCFSSGETVAGMAMHEVALHWTQLAGV